MTRFASTMFYLLEYVVTKSSLGIFYLSQFDRSNYFTCLNIEDYVTELFFFHEFDVVIVDSSNQTYLKFE